MAIVTFTVLCSPPPRSVWGDTRSRRAYGAPSVAAPPPLLVLQLGLRETRHLASRKTPIFSQRQRHGLRGPLGRGAGAGKVGEGCSGAGSKAR
eukprot:752166-Prymnesium_polylepis.1